MCLTYDSTQAESFESLNYWIEELQEKVETEQVMIAIVSSKIDFAEA